MQGIPDGPQDEEYPIIESGVTIEWCSRVDPIPDLVHILGLYADEDGEIQVRIHETHPDTQDGSRTIALDDLYKSMDFREYEVRE